MPFDKYMYKHIAQQNNDAKNQQNPLSYSKVSCEWAQNHPPGESNMRLLLHNNSNSITDYILREIIYKGS